MFGTILQAGERSEVFLGLVAHESEIACAERSHPVGKASKEWRYTRIEVLEFTQQALRSLIAGVRADGCIDVREQDLRVGDRRVECRDRRVCGLTICCTRRAGLDGTNVVFLEQCFEAGDGGAEALHRVGEAARLETLVNVSDGPAGK